MRRLIYLLSLLVCCTTYVTPGIALGIGILLALTVRNPFPHLERLTKPLLQTSVVLLGFGMNCTVVLRVGAEGFALTALTILGTFVLGFVLSKVLRTTPVTTLLLSSGTAICGGSAIAAVGAVVSASQIEMSVAMGTVFLLNALALFLAPVIGSLCNLTSLQFGTWAGIALHDVSSVVGAATQYGDEALQIATAVKLSRTLWIIPLTLIVGWFYQSKHQGDIMKKIRIPWFIAYFILASALSTFVPGVASFSPLLTMCAKKGLTVTLFLIGGTLSRESLSTVGIKPILLGIYLWIFIGLSTLLAVTMK